MAVFLVNQCTFSKLPEANNDQQTSVTINNGASQYPNDSASNITTNNVGVGLSSSNICGQKFDSLFELIHHIEDNHITDVDYSGIYPGSAPGAVIGGPATGMVNTPTLRDSNIYNVIPHDRHHMTQIINGGWLPTSCILRIFNSTHKTPKQIKPPTHQLLHKLQAPQPIAVDMVHQSPQMCATTPLDGTNSHHVILASPKVVGNLNCSPYQVTSGSITTSQPSVNTVASVATVANQAINNAQQQVNLNNSIQQQQQLQLQPQQQLQLQPQQLQLPQQQQIQIPQQQLQLPQQQLQIQPQQQLQLQPQQQLQLQQQQQQQLQPHQTQLIPTPTVISKPTKVYKCTDCSKTYKTMHGLRTHQSTHHPNSPQTDGKAMAIMPEGGDTPSGSPADIPQQQNKTSQQ